MCSKILNFTVNYDETGAAEIRLGDSGNGVNILKRNNSITTHYKNVVPVKSNITF